jgi:hypothetical protein
LLLLLQLDKWRVDGRLAQNVAVIGAGEMGRAFLKHLADVDTHEFRIVGVFDDRKDRLPSELEGHKVSGTVDDLIAHSKTGAVDAIIVAMPWQASSDLQELIKKLKTVPVHVAHDLGPDEVRALRVADNKTATFSGWDDAKLADELAVIFGGLGKTAVTGFSQSELDAILMRASAEVPAIAAPAGSPADEDEDFDLGDDASDGDSDGGDLPAADPEAAAASSPAPSPDLVPFNALMTVDARQVVYDAIAQAKRRHTLETTADALLVIARSYIDA